MSDSWPADELRAWVTIHGDAGFKPPRARVAFLARGWAGWGPKWLSWTYEPPGVKDVQTAEALALLYGFRGSLWTWTPRIPGGVRGFFLRNDNLGVIQRLQAGSGGVSGIAACICDKLLDEAARAGAKLHAKHVPGHSQADSTAAWMNRAVDQRAHLRGR